MLTGSGLIWFANIVTFACGTGRSMAAGRRAPARRPRHHRFPVPAAPGRRRESSHGWAPGFLDYLFVAWNASTAFSPTDTLVMSRRVKVLMMIQTLTSLTTIAVLAARAINTLG